MKRIILASNNKDKIKEVKEILTGYDIISIKEAYKSESYYEDYR